MTQKRRPTIIDVARKAGVSKSTVSLVLQNKTTVRAETRAQVRDAMHALGYVYNRAAANMRSANAGLIGLVINDLRNPFFTEFATSLQMALARRGYSAVLANTDEDPRIQAQVIGAMIEHGVSALMICPTYGGDGADFDALARAGLPAMQMLRRGDERLDLFPFIAPDYRAGSLAATQHLLASGARRIAFLGGLEGRAVTEERKAGYLDAMRDAGATPIVMTGRASRAWGRDAAATLFARHPDIEAAMCFNDLVALGLLAGCQADGHRRVGQTFRIIGFDDIEDVALVYPPLSSVRCDIARIGAESAQTLIAWLEEGTVPPPETRSPVTLAIRQSSAAAG